MPVRCPLLRSVRLWGLSGSQAGSSTVCMVAQVESKGISRFEGLLVLTG